MESFHCTRLLNKLANDCLAFERKGIMADFQSVCMTNELVCQILCFAVLLRSQHHFVIWGGWAWQKEI
jgi:hypothetical protein